MQAVDLQPKASFPPERWWVAAFSWELKDKPLARTLLNHRVVLFRTPDGRVSALQDRCCHKDLPLSLGAVEERGLRCGYHGLLFDCAGTCIEVPGQDRIPAKARVPAFQVEERDQIVWIWIGASPDSRPTEPPPEYEFHGKPGFRFGGGVVHYAAPYQLIHDNLLDLSHLGYVHVFTIGGNPGVHMTAETKVDQQGDVVRVIRHMPGSQPPPTYSAAYPFKELIDRWQEIEFHVSHLRIWTGAVDQGAESLQNPQRGGFHMRGFHGVTPETDSSSHYFWTIATNPQQDHDNVLKLVVDQTEKTFFEDKAIIEAQWDNQRSLGFPPQVDIHVDIGPNRARRVIDRLLRAAA